MFASIFATLRDFYRREFWETSAATTEYNEGYVLSFTGKSWQSGANQLWIDDPACFNALVLDHAARFFRPFKAEWSVLVLPPVHSNLYQHIVGLGGYSLWSHPVMLLDGIPALDPNPHIRFERVQGDLARQTAYHILSEAYQLAYNPQQEMFRPDHENDPTLGHYLAYYDGHPAAIGTLNFVQGMAGVWNVGTRPMFRRRGLARAMMLHLCQVAQTAGYPATVLLSTSQGFSLYHDLGYQTIATAYYMGFSVV